VISNLDLAFRWGSWAVWLAVVVAAGALRGRVYALFAAVILGIHTLVSTALFPHMPRELAAPVSYLQLAVYVHFVSLVRAQLRPAWFRFGLSMPGLYFAAGTMLAFPWAIAAGLGATPHGLFVPYLAALFGLLQSLRTPEQIVDIDLGESIVPLLQRHRSGPFRSNRPLELVQITDPHLGPFMPVARLREICERAVQKNPHLVLLTGDFVTMESHSAEAELTLALAPLRALPGRVFACLGNHDHEAPETVARALAAVGAKLLVDEAVVVETPAGRVQILGLDYRRRGRQEHMARVTAEHPRRADAFRLVLLHDPGAFKLVPEGDADLVLSGHTHGGQVGLLSLGLPHTFVSALSIMPDHGLWARGKDRLYVHRGTGHYGFPLRVGVPAEESLLRIHSRSWARDT
jgi:predicted MPP superfamily phosphohydrolase